MVFDRRAIDARAIGLQVLLRGDQGGLRACRRAARMLQLLARHRARAASRSRRARSPWRVELGLADVDRRLQLCGGREKAAHFAHRARELRFGLLERDLASAWSSCTSVWPALTNCVSSAPMATTVPEICGVICTTLPLTYASSVDWTSRSASAQYAP